MAWTKTKADCDTYFHPDNHVKSYNWRSYTVDEQNAAFNQAYRELTANQGRDLEDPTTDTQVYRDDYAVYEQALWILQNTPRQGSSGVPQVIDLAKDEEKEILDRKGVLISPDAKMYFELSSIKMVRG